MYTNLLRSFLILIILFTSNCGFKVLDVSKKNNYTIKEVETFGDKRINFKIKNNILGNSLVSGGKNIKEKNIKNEITKYEIRLNSDLVFRIIDNNNDYKINASVAGDYLVEDSYSSTLNNEKKLIDNLVNEISDKISDRITLKINAL